MTFTYWFNEVADMPMKDENGRWYDAETGFPFGGFQSTKKVVTVKSDAEINYGYMKIAQLFSTVQRLVESQKYSVKKYFGKVDTSSAEAVVEMFEAITKPTKSQLYEIIEANSKASRIMNKLTNQGRL